MGVTRWFLKAVYWMGSSRKDLRAFPKKVQSDMGYALYAAQQGELDPDAKPLKGFGGAHVIEIGFIRKGRTEMAKKRNYNKIAFEEGSGNVFADLGFVNAEQELLKAHLTLQIYKVVKARKLTQSRAAELLGIKQPHVSLLMRNRAGSFSVERLMDFLTDLGHDVEIRVKPTRKNHGQVSVVVAA